MKNMQQILLVEDDNTISNLLITLLAAEGYTTTLCSYGDQVVKLIHQNQPDLVLLNLIIPIEVGFAVCQKIRLFSDLPIIMMSEKQVIMSV